MQTHRLYNNDKLWAQYGTTPDYCERARIVCSLIPDTVKRVIDVGCGIGEVLATIIARRETVTGVGCDISRSALCRMCLPTVCAGLPNLPFPDGCFDMVVCLEVLEHIEQDVYAASLQELERLAKHYIIIGVPYRENLLAKRVKCARCGKTSHVDGHVRAYDRSTLQHLFQSFVLRNIILTGVLQKRQSLLGMWLKLRFGGLYYRPELFSCPFCNSEQWLDKEPGVPVFARKVALLLANLLAAGRQPQPYWILGLYGRKGT